MVPNRRLNYANFTHLVKRNCTIYAPIVRVGSAVLRMARCADFYLVCVIFAYYAIYALRKWLCCCSIWSVLMGIAHPLLLFNVVRVTLISFHLEAYGRD